MYQRIMYSFSAYDIDGTPLRDYRWFLHFGDNMVQIKVADNTEECGEFLKNLEQLVMDIRETITE